MAPEEKLPTHLLEQADLCGKEYAWPLELIPEVIEAARAANLLNLGGQLQFRTNPGTCEAYHIEVDPCKSISENIAWDSRVQLACKIALEEFKKLPEKWDFIEEGWVWAKKYPDLFPLGERSIKNSMCFVWYVADQDYFASLRAKSEAIQTKL